MTVKRKLAIDCAVDEFSEIRKSEATVHEL